MTLDARKPSPWPRRLLLGAVVTLLPLFLFGGTVTTIGAGLAVEGWWNAEGHFMPFFPVEKWFRDLHTFVEHSHREFGIVLGLFMLGACVATWRTDRRRSARVLVIAATLAVCFQGWLGGSRVLEKSPQLAFLHGAFAQAVFAIVFATFAFHTRAWFQGVRAKRGEGGGTALSALRFAAPIAALCVYAQSVMGAWYRHGLRNDLGAGIEHRLMLHIVGAFGVFFVVMWLLARLAAAARGGGEDEEQVDPVLDGLRRRLAFLIWFQVGLGFFAWATNTGSEVGFLEWLTSTLHVLVGALLLAHCVLAAVFARRPSEASVDAAVGLRLAEGRSS